jgi:hypothetical protein
MLQQLHAYAYRQVPMTTHGDIACITMPKPIFLAENSHGEIYKHPTDRMKYLDPKNESTMPVFTRVPSKPLTSNLTATSYRISRPVENK